MGFTLLSDHLTALATSAPYVASGPAPESCAVVRRTCGRDAGSDATAIDPSPDGDTDAALAQQCSAASSPVTASPCDKVLPLGRRSSSFSRVGADRNCDLRGAATQGQVGRLAAVLCGTLARSLCCHSRVNAPLGVAKKQRNSKLRIWCFFINVGGKKIPSNLKK
jgi:hypothetical protein